MALDLTGINNVGEFCSHHYLDAVLEGDLKAIFGRWKEREQDHGVKGPEKRLAAPSGTGPTCSGKSACTWRPTRTSSPTARC